MYLNVSSTAKILVLFFLFLNPFWGNSQKFTARILDMSGHPVHHAEIKITTADQKRITLQNVESGEFFLDSLGYGKLEIYVFAEGYTPLNIFYWNTIQSKDPLLIYLQKDMDVQLDSLTVTASSQLADYDGNIFMTRSQYKTMAGSFQDPSRVMLHFPGLSTDNDGTNAFFFRGLPGYGTHWQIFDAEIVNPNHLATAGNRGDVASLNSGGVTALSASVIGNYTFSPNPSNINLANTTAGVSNIHLAPKLTNYLDMSLIGAETGICTKRKDKYTYATARYSFVGLLEKLGIPFGNESINYQDFTFFTDIIKKQNFFLKGFLIYGQSSNNHNALPLEEEKFTEKDFKNINYSSRLAIMGLHGKKTLKNNQIISFSLNFSSRRDNHREFLDSLYNNLFPNRFINTKIISGLLSSHFFYTKSLKNVQLTFGLRANYHHQPYLEESNTSTYDLGNTKIYPYVDFSKNWSSWSFQAGAGLHSVITNFSKEYHTPNYSATIEKKISKTSYVRLQHRFSDQLIPLDFFNVSFIHLKTRASEISLGRNTKSFSWRLSTYYYKIFNNRALLNKEENLISSFNGLDFGTDIFDVSFGSNNDARTYGGDFWLLKSFSLGNNILELTGNAGYVVSEFQNLKNQWQPAKNNIGWTGSVAAYLLIQRKRYEWNFGFLFHGRQGLGDYPVSENPNLTLYDFSGGLTNRQNPYARTDIRVVFTKKGGARRQHRFSLDIQNVTNRKNDGFLYYDRYLQRVNRLSQLGLVPVLGYRFEF
ncbi:MAG: hypothetical protein IPN79_13045 [Saprospiraceae bacterium]|nr:hypothetical protein [Saprospiraceae bacterium]